MGRKHKFTHEPWAYCSHVELNSGTVFKKYPEVGPPEEGPSMIPDFLSPKILSASQFSPEPPPITRNTCMIQWCHSVFLSLSPPVVLN